MKTFWIEFATDLDNHLTYESTRVKAKNERDAELTLKERELKKGFKVHIVSVELVSNLRR